MVLKEEEEKWFCPSCGHSISQIITKEEIAEKLGNLKKILATDPKFDFRKKK